MVFSPLNGLFQYSIKQKIQQKILNEAKVHYIFVVLQLCLNSQFLHYIFYKYV